MASFGKLEAKWKVKNIIFHMLSFINILLIGTATKTDSRIFLLKSWVTQNFITIKTSWNTND
jgi:hypothetical protein